MTKAFDPRLRNIARLGCIAAALALSVDAQAEDAFKARLLDPRQHRIGRLIPDLNITDNTGKSLRLSEALGERALVISAGDADKKSLEAARAAFAQRGVAFLGLGPTKQAIAAALGLSHSADVFVLDRKRTLVYRGAAGDAATSYLSLALEDVLADGAVRFPATRSRGRAVAVNSAPAAAPVTWHNRISRIVQQNCAECHREGENAPFPLRTFRDVKGYKGMIARVVADKSMPPWFADPEVGHWKKDRSLSAEDRRDVLSWIKAGTPKGEAADAPVKRKFVKGWRIGKPDAVLQIPKEFEIPAEGTIRYQYTTLKTDFPEDRWVEAVEIRPGAPEVVHHVLIWVRFPPGHPKAKGRQRINRRGYFAGMAPGETSVTFPRDYGKLLPKGATLIFQLHYTANGVPTTDRTSVGLRFRDSAPKHELRTSGVSNPGFVIPPGDPNYKIVAKRRLKKPTRIVSFSPHMHVRGKAFKYEAIYPDGRTEVLCNVPRYDFNWQFMLWLREPIDLPSGTVLRCTAWYDNSDGNPANPDPKRSVTFGEQTWDEMMIGFYNGIELDEEPAAKAKKAKPKAEKPEAKKRRFYR